MENELFDYIKEIITQKLSVMGISLYYSYKQDFLGIKFAEEDRYYICFISNYSGNLTLSYRKNCFEREVHRYNINKDHLEELQNIISDTISNNIALYRDIYGSIEEIQKHHRNVTANEKKLNYKPKDKPLDVGHNIELKDILPLINEKHYRFEYTEEDYVRYIAFNNDIEELFDVSLNKLGKGRTSFRNISIYKMRIGLTGGNATTLQQVGDTYGLSRERIRQIMNEISHRIKKYKNDFIIMLNTLPEEDLMNYFVEGIGSVHGLHYIKTLFEIVGNGKLAYAIYECIQTLQNTTRRINNVNSPENKILSNIVFPSSLRVVTQADFDAFEIQRAVNEHDECKNGQYALKNGTNVVEYESFLERRIISILDRAYYVDDVKTQSIIIPYERNGIRHRYYPDILMHTKDNKLAVIEVKSLYEMGTTQTLIKYYALKEYCEKNGFGYLVTDERYNTIESLVDTPVSKEFEVLFLDYLREFRQVNLKMVKAFFGEHGLHMDFKILMKILIKNRDSVVYSVRPFCIKYIVARNGEL